MLTDGTRKVYLSSFQLIGVVRNKCIVDLPFHSWLLLQKCGFKLPQISFWRVLYRRKHPEVERINHEYILLCKK